MGMPEPQKSHSVEQALDQVDNYEQTIEALVAFANIILEKYSGHPLICKVMQLADDPEKKVTPDLVAEIGNYSLIAEIKKSLPRDEDRWDSVDDQIRKYDKPMIGWRGNPSPHDLFLLCHQTVSYRAASHFQKLNQSKVLTLSHNFCVIAFNRSSQRLTFMFFKKERGAVGHKDLDEQFVEGIQVPLESIVAQLSAIKFYDSEPDVVYTMAILWDHVFPRLASEEELRESKGRKTISVEVNIDHLLQELRTYFAPPENRDVVERKWVKAALDAFVRIDLAEEVPREKGRYLVSFRNIPEETTIQFFARKLYGEPQIKLQAYF